MKCSMSQKYWQGRLHADVLEKAQISLKQPIFASLHAYLRHNYELSDKRGI